MLSEILDFPSPMRAICGTTAEKSAPGFAVPDSVHHVKLVCPCKLPLRCTGIWADDSPAATSTVSVANSTFDGPICAAKGGAMGAAEGGAIGAAAGAAVGAAVGCAAVSGAAAGGDAAGRAGTAEGGGAAESGAVGAATGLAREAGVEVGAGGGAARGAGARTGAPESMRGRVSRWLIQYAPPSSNATPAAIPVASRDKLQFLR